MLNKVNKDELAGFTLYGTREEDGIIQLGESGRTVEEWPSEVSLGKGFYTYGLELVRLQVDSGTREVYAVDLNSDRDHTGREWGVYM